MTRVLSAWLRCTSGGGNLVGMRISDPATEWRKVSRAFDTHADKDAEMDRMRELGVEFRGTPW